MTTLLTGDPQGFTTPRAMTPDELGDHVARLVWESFTDFVSADDTEIPLQALGVETAEGLPDQRAAEEALIFLMWAHTRGVQLGFAGRAPGELVREGLDTMHSAVFDDMVANGTPRAQLPIFEQRVSARYAEYSGAAEHSDTALGAAVVRNLTGRDRGSDAHVRAVSERAIAVANPLRDFLEDVDLVR